MSLTLRPLEPETIPQAPKPVTLDQAQLISLVAEVADNAISARMGAVTQVAQEMLAEVERRLARIEAPKPQILAIEIQGNITRLKTAAHPLLGRLIINAKLGLNTLLVGPAGCGKTFVAHQLADALGRDFAHVCFTAGASETWLFGRQTPQGFIEGPFSRLYRLGGVFLADEFDAADANMLLALNTALANGTLFNPMNGETYARHADFVFVAGANTVGKGSDAVYTGRNRLDGATLDRFVCLGVDYNTELERQFCPDPIMFKLLTEARATLKRLRAEEIISTRAFQKAALQLGAGISGQEILDSLTQGWPAELISQCKLDKYPKAYTEAAVKAEAPKPKHALEADEKIAANEARIAELKARLEAEAKARAGF